MRGNIELILKAAESGDREAQFEAGCHYLGKNDKKALHWFLQAVEGNGYGALQAMIELASMYGSGKGVRANLVEAYKWALLGERMDEYVQRDETPKARFPHMGEFIQKSMTKDQIAEARKLADQWWGLHKG